MIKLMEAAEQKTASPRHVPKFVVPFVVLVIAAALGFWMYQMRAQSAQQAEAQKGIRAALIAKAMEIKKLEKEMDIAPPDLRNEAFVAFRDASKVYQQQCEQYAGSWPKDEPLPSVPCRSKPYRQ